MKTDVLIVGGGPGGTAAAMFLAREGIASIIVEMASFPRYHIGESMTGATADVVRNLGLETAMTLSGFPTKKGVKVFGPAGHGDWWVPVTGRDGSWNLYDSFTWQVRRSQFDAMMLDEAAARGAAIIRGKAVRPLLRDDGSVYGAKVRLPDGSMVDIRAEVLLDCSGQATFLANAGVTGPKYLGSYDKQIAIFSQVEGALRDDNSSRMCDRDNTLIFYQKKYHWAWFIPLDDEVVSVGVVSPSSYYLEKKEGKEDFLRRELAELNIELNRRVPNRNFVEDTHVIPNYSYQVRGFCGRNFICLGDAHRFIDPIFSFGLTVTMREADFAARSIRQFMDGVGRDDVNPFAAYQRFVEQGADVLEDMIDLFWEQPFAFALSVHRRYTDYMTDAFAGRIYEHQPSPAINTFRSMLKRERTYGVEDLYSVPIGSRFHPERAPLWQATSPVPSTEEWLGPR